MTIHEAAVLFFATVGVVVMLISAIGILHLPDVYARMHSASKAATLGVNCVLIAAGLFYPNYLLRMILLIALFFVTAPIATSAMARAAYRTAKLGGKFVLRYDELAEDDKMRG
ncbi:MAG: monovalent cation/H(+) antiporter subunit G [Caldilineaceae bacterium]|nr:monovalent cation/H(+) antiporter subunit G [Caldilineaceae bacterium]